MTDDIKQIPTAVDEIRASVESIRRALPVMVEASAEIANARWEMYCAYKKAGFSDQQALDLCKSMIL